MHLSLGLSLICEICGYKCIKKKDIIICFIMIFLSSDIDQALYLFNELREQDPFRIENMDTFSNLLYVRVRAAGAHISFHFI